ncbi:MAG: CtsR family transcriptional regulator [Clostridia bacterium]|nr:CtsR family transcriptional regulator [Clostridia bacterium]
MASRSDIIEQFILNTLASEPFIELSRNDLAKFFACAPSQINYVLNTRFTVNNGYVIESVRGGAGFIKVIRLSNNRSNLQNLLDICAHPLNIIEGNQILDNLASRNLISGGENQILKRAISTKALNNPLNMEETIRANILKEIIIEVMKRS